MPAKSIAHTIGILLDPQHISWDIWHGTLANAILNTLKREGNDPLYVSWRPGLARDPAWSGLIVSTHSGQIDGRLVEWLVKLAEEGLPVVTVDWNLPSITSVEIDNKTGLYHVARYLVELGHRAIAYIGPNSPTSGERLDGLRAALAEVGARFDESLFRVVDPNARAAYSMFPAFYGAHRFTAICCFEDGMATGVSKAAKEMDLLVPAGLSVAGFGNLGAGEFSSPSLTTVDVNPAELANRAISLLKEMLRSRISRPARVRVPTQLLVRQSTGPVGSDRP